MEKSLQWKTKACSAMASGEHEAIMGKIGALYGELFLHDGFGELRVTMRFLKKGQKEVVVACGKEYRFVVDYPDRARR